MGLLDVNALVALAWDAHVHHASIRRWFARHAQDGWATCPITEAGFVRVSANPKVLTHAVSVTDARRVLAGLRAAGAHRGLANDVSLVDPDVPALAGHRQVTDAVLLTLARRRGVPLITFDRALWALADGDGVVLLER